MSATVTQYLSFRVGEDEYAVPSAVMREIAAVAPMTRVPAVPAWIRGVVNLRGQVLPVADLASRLGLGETVPQKRSCLLVVELGGASGVVLSALVDAVVRVLDVAPAQVEPRPSLGVSVPDEYVVGLVKAGDRYVVLLDPARLFGAADRAVLAKAGGGTSAPAPQIAAAPPPSAVAPPPASEPELVFFDE
jgi:purine-binding chemotaxis protein CheW